MATSKLSRIRVSGTRIREEFGGKTLPAPRREIVFDGRIKDLGEVWLGSYVAPAIASMALSCPDGRLGDWEWSVLPWTADYPRPVSYPLSREERDAPVQGPSEEVA